MNIYEVCCANYSTPSKTTTLYLRVPSTSGRRAKSPSPCLNLALFILHFIHNNIYIFRRCAVQTIRHPVLRRRCIGGRLLPMGEKQRYIPPCFNLTVSYCTLIMMHFSFRCQVCFATYSTSSSTTTLYLRTSSTNGKRAKIPPSPTAKEWRCRRSTNSSCGLGKLKKRRIKRTLKRYTVRG